MQRCARIMQVVGRLGSATSPNTVHDMKDSAASASTAPPAAFDAPEALECARRLAAGLGGQYSYAPHFLEVQGGALHYIDEGPRSSTAILCLHGNPTWSFYWRSLVDALSSEHRVVVPDHLGMGLSTRPDRDVRLGEHVENVVRLVDHLGLQEVTLVCHDWGGAIGFGAALQRRREFVRFLVTNTAAFPSGRMPKRIALCRTPLLGKLLVQGANSFAGLATRMAVRRPLEARVKAAYLAPYRTWKDRRQIDAFVRDIPMNERHPSWAELCRISDGLDGLRGLPMTIVWGDRDWCFDPLFRSVWEQRFPAAEVCALADAGHYLMEDAPDSVIDATRALVRKNIHGRDE